MPGAPTLTGGRQGRIDDPGYALVVDRLRRAGFDDRQIETALQQTPKPGPVGNPFQPRQPSPLESPLTVPRVRPGTGRLNTPPNANAQGPGAPLPRNPQGLPLGQRRAPEQEGPPGLPASSMVGGILGTGPVDAATRPQVPGQGAIPPIPDPIGPASRFGAGPGGSLAQPGPITPLTPGGADPAAPGGGPIGEPAPFRMADILGQDSLTQGPAQGPLPQLPKELAQAIPPGGGDLGGPPPGSGIPPEFWDDLMKFGLATMSASGRPGATFFGSVGEGGLSALKGVKGRKQQRRLDRAEKREERRLNIQEQNASRDPIADTVADKDGKVYGVTRNGKKIDLGISTRVKGEYTKPQALDVARKVATTQTTNEFGASADQFNPEVFNKIITQLGYPEMKLDASPAGGAPAQITSDAEFKALPSGAEFMDPNGQRRRKP